VSKKLKPGQKIQQGGFVSFVRQGKNWLIEAM
jgi:hypothetical protein